MPGETVREQETLQVGPLTKNGVAVEGVDGVQTRPTTGDLELVKCRDELNHLFPELVDEDVAVEGEVNTDRVVVEALADQKGIFMLLDNV